MSTTPRTDDRPCQATPSADLRQQIMDSRVPKNEREWWSQRTIEKLETELACEKGNRNHLIEKGAKLETELDAEREKVRVLRGQLENASAYFAIRELGDPAKLLCGKIDAALAATKEGA